MQAKIKCGRIWQTLPAVLKTVKWAENTSSG